MTESYEDIQRAPWRNKLYEIIFESDTWAGKLFDIALLWCIVFSVVAVMLESVDTIRQVHGELLRKVEWAFTIVFTIEYVLRLASARKPTRYATSFFGLVDLIAIVPTYISLFLPGTQFLLTVRALRLLRIFRVLKLMQYLGEAETLLTALRASRAKIIVFLYSVLTLVLVIGTMMYLIEGEQGGFTSIPRSVYWAIVTLTTVGYGDLAPVTPIGQFFACIVMVLGYAIIAVPTGIVTAELTRGSTERLARRECSGCDLDRHSVDAVYCRHCGTELS